MWCETTAAGEEAFREKKDMAGIGSVRKTTLGRRHRKERVREGKNKTEKNETGRSGIMNKATAGNGLNCLPGSAKL